MGFQAMHDSYETFYSNESLVTVDQRCNWLQACVKLVDNISVICHSLRYFTEANNFYIY